jgi:hypothetical protein
MSLKFDKNFKSEGKSEGIVGFEESILLMSQENDNTKQILSRSPPTRPINVTYATRLTL